MKIKVINLTPSKGGKMCIPAINLNYSNNFSELNMVTCGGQASIPIANAIGKTQKNVE